MSFLNHLVFQPIDKYTDTDVAHVQADNIDLNEPVDDASVENYLNQMVQDVREDPEWFNFDDK